MRWLRRLLAGPTRAQDALFGQMRYMGGYWEGRGLFAPTQLQVEYFVAGDQAGPAEANRQTFQRICERYASMLPAVAAIIERKAAQIRVRCPGLETLRLSGIDIPASLEEDALWEMMFDAPHGTFIAVQIRGTEPTGEVEWSR